MSPQTLIPPRYLSAVGFAVGLCVALRGLDGGAGVDEENAGHAESSEGHGYGLGWVSGSEKEGRW